MRGFLVVGIVAALLWAVEAAAQQGRRQTTETYSKTEVDARLDANEKVVNSRVEALTAKVDSYLVQLNAAQKQVDWWLAAITWALAALTLVAGVIPFFLAKRLRQEHEDRIREAERISSELKRYVDQARSDVTSIQEARKTLDRFASGEAKGKEILSAAKTVLAEPTAQRQEQLRALLYQHMEKGDVEAAVQFGRDLVQSYPDDPTALTDFGWALIRLAVKRVGQERNDALRSAVESLTTAVRRDPSLTTAWTNLSWAYLMLGNGSTDSQEKRAFLERGLQHAHEALSCNPKYYFALNNAGKLMYELGRISAEPEKAQLLRQAVDYLERAIQIRPDDTLARDNLRLVEQALPRTR